MKLSCGEPIAIANAEAVSRPAKIADVFLSGWQFFLARTFEMPH
jgi:hypothetical protein